MKPRMTVIGRLQRVPSQWSVAARRARPTKPAVDPHGTARIAVTSPMAPPIATTVCGSQSTLPASPRKTMTQPIITGGKAIPHARAVRLPSRIESQTDLARAKPATPAAKHPIASENGITGVGSSGRRPSLPLRSFDRYVELSGDQVAPRCGRMRSSPLARHLECGACREVASRWGRSELRRRLRVKSSTVRA